MGKSNSMFYEWGYTEEGEFYCNLHNNFNEHNKEHLAFINMHTLFDSKGTPIFNCPCCGREVRYGQLGRAFEKI